MVKQIGIIATFLAFAIVIAVSQNIPRDSGAWPPQVLRIPLGQLSIIFRR